MLFQLLLFDALLQRRRISGNRSVFGCVLRRFLLFRILLLRACLSGAVLPGILISSLRLYA